MRIGASWNSFATQVCALTVKPFQPRFHNFLYTTYGGFMSLGGHLSNRAWHVRLLRNRPHSTPVFGSVCWNRARDYRLIVLVICALYYSRMTEDTCDSFTSVYKSPHSSTYWAQFADRVLGPTLLRFGNLRDDRFSNYLLPPSPPSYVSYSTVRNDSLRICILLTVE